MKILGLVVLFLVAGLFASFLGKRIKAGYERQVDDVDEK